MQKKMGAVLLVAGTCIGSGMIALPMVLAKLGLIPSIILMLVIWFIMYYTSLVNVELNLQAGRGLALGALGKHFSGKTAKFIGTISLKILSYSLLAVFIYGGSSILQKLIACKTGVQYSFFSVASCYTLVAMLFLLLHIKLIDYLNRILFFGLLIVVAILIVGLAVSANWSNLPLFSEHYKDPVAWCAIIPVVFTSFGFQVIFHTLTNYCNKNAVMLKHVCFWGSFIPAIIYILWTSSILSVVHHKEAAFYHQMVDGKADVGELIQVLSAIAKWQSVQILIWWISSLAIATSVLGVGVGLSDSLKGMMSKTVTSERMRNIYASMITILPAYLAVIYVPNAFIAVLGFAGMILAVIAILLPIYLFWKIKSPKLHFDELRMKWLIHLSFVAAILVITCELYTL